MLDTTKAQVVILGTGKAKFERMVEQLDKQNPNLKVRPFTGQHCLKTHKDN